MRALEYAGMLEAEDPGTSYLFRLLNVGQMSDDTNDGTPDSLGVTRLDDEKTG